MIKTTLRQAYTRCINARTGLPALNYSDMWDLMAIAQAAQQMNTDVIVASNPLVAKTIGCEMCQSMVNAINNTVSVSIFNHLDHSSSVDLCIQAIDAGYPSVMIDGSSHSLQENIRVTSEVIKYAKKKGVLVEAEIGKIKGKGIEGDFAGGTFLAEVSDAAELVNATHVDALAVGIGTAHGFYTEEPKIYFDRLREIAAVVQVPLVLHGGTGIPDADIRQAIQDGITKVNVGTIIHTTYMCSLREELVKAEPRPYTLDIMKNVLPSIEQVVADRIRVIAGTT
jgi:ketose-bisphosphate aldolase